MAEAKKLPEISISDGPIVNYAKRMVELRTEIASLKDKEDQACNSIKAEAETLRKFEANKVKGRSFIGLIRIVDKDTPPVRCEFRMAKNSALALTEESKLTALFGASRPLLFGRDKVITEITNPSALIKELELQGKNPWDYLNLTVKPELDRAIADSKNVIAQEAFLPKKGFLETLNDIASTLKDEAVTFAKQYLDSVLTPVVSMTKAKGESK
jgi:hypothetical protein